MSTFRCRLVLFGVISMIPLLALTFYNDLRYRTQEELKARRDIKTTARLVASNVEKSVEGARQLLVAASQALELSGKSEDLCKGYVTKLTRIFPQYANVLVVRPDGKVLCSGLTSRPHINLADRLYFRRALSENGFAMGEFQIGRITGRPSINFGYPLRDRSGVVKGVAVVALDLAWLNKSLEGIDLPEDSTVGLVDGNGTFLAHYPDSPKWIGRPVKETYPQLSLSGMSHEFSSEVTGDGRACYLSFVPIHIADGLLYAVVGISKSAVFFGPNHILIFSLAVLGIVFILGLTFAASYGRLFLVRPLNKMLAVTTSIGEGNLSARVGAPYGPGEFGLLAKALDDMADSLEMYFVERVKACHSLEESEAMLGSFFDSPGAIRGIAMVVDEDIRFLYGNEAAATLFGYSKESFRNKSASEIGISLELVRLWLDRYEESKQSGKPVNFEFSHGEGAKSKWIAAMVSFLGPLSEGNSRFGFVAHDVTEKKRDEAQIERQFSRLAALRDIDMAITSSLDMRVMMRIIIDEVISQLHVDAADILLINPHEMTLEYVLGRGFRTNALKHSRLRLGQGHAGIAALERKTIRVSGADIESGSFALSRELPKEDFVDYVAVPLVSKGHVKGVLEIFNRTPLDVDPEWNDFLESLGTQSAIAIDNADMYNNLQRSHAELVIAYNTTLEGWSRALDYRDKETEGHSKRVTDLTVAIARAVGMTEAELVHVRRGALLHDIGKLGVPDSILLKPGKLTEEEWAIMKRHPVIAYELLSPITFLKEAIDIPYCHHEKWDGTGYPRGLKGEQIPLAARIFALVDVWDALKCDRPYRSAWPNEEVLEYIRNNAGVHFDPEIVPVFLNLIEKI